MILTPEERAEVVVGRMKQIRAGQPLTRGNRKRWPWGSLRNLIIEQIREAEQALKGG